MIRRTYFTMADCGVAKNDLVQRMLGTYGSILADHMMHRYAHNWIVKTDVVIRFDGDVAESTPSQADINAFLDKVYTIYTLTRDRYTKLLSLYSSYESKLMDGLTDSATVRFNDTPQNGGDWSDDQHTTNITQSTSLRDVESVMDKLDGVSKKYRDLYRDWLEEFSPLFGEDID